MRNTSIGSSVQQSLFLAASMMISIPNWTSFSAAAFVVPSSIEVPPSHPLYFPPTKSVDTTKTPSTESSSSTVTTASWRVALNLGREVSTPLWDSYGASGIRFPVVVPCEFSIDVPTGDQSVLPISDTVSYVADIHGGTTKPVVGGDWSITTSESNKKDSSSKRQSLGFTLHFPEELKKNDVRIPGGSTLVMETVVYPQDELKRLEQAFGEARREEWDALRQMEDIENIRRAPKRWNPETQRWEYPRIEEPLTSLLSKQWDAFVKGQRRRQKFREKPRSGVELSARPGRFPGFAPDNLVYFGTRGIIRNVNQGGMVVGTWTAEPMYGQPASSLGGY